MSSRLYVRRPTTFGGDHIELTDDYGPRRGVPFFRQNESLIQLGMRCYDGEAAQGSFLFTDPYADPDADPFATSFPLGHSLVTWTEDAPGSEVWLFRGRVADDEGGRGDAVVDHETEWTITCEDGNVDLRGQAFTEHWVRPEETDIERLVALQLYTLNGASSTATKHRDTCVVIVNTSHLAPNTNTVTMPAKKYVAGTQPQDVVKDCADMAGKTYGVVIHHTGGSHLCLFYTIPEDHTTYLSNITISDHLEDWDPEHPTDPVFEPHWERGSATIFEMQTLLSGLVGTWGSSEQFTFVENTAVRDNFDYWVDAYSAGDASSLADATTRTAGVFVGRRETHVTHMVSIILNPDQVDMIAAGMSLEMRTAATHDPDVEAFITRRVAQCQFEPILDEVHGLRYWAHLDLERPPKGRVPGRGHVGPIPPNQSEPAPGATIDYLWDTFPAPNGYDDTGHLIPAGQHPGDFPGSVYSTSLEPSCGTGSFPLTAGTYHFRCIWRSNDPGETKFVGLYNQTLGGTLVANTALVTGTTEETFDYTVLGSHSFQLRTNGPSSGHRAAIFLLEVSHGGGGASFVGTQVPPASSDSQGAVGVSPIFSPIDHMHPAQIAAVTTITDAGGYYDSGDVENALQELGASIGEGGVVDHGLLSGLGDDDHPQYLRASDGEKAIINVVSDAGSAETLDLALGNVQDLTLTEDCTITLAAATAGVACSMAVLLRQDGTGNWAVTWPGSVEWVGDDPPTLQTAANSWDWVQLLTLDGGTTWFGQHGGAASGGSNVPPAILLESGHATPFTFDEILQESDGSDFLWASE